MTKEREKHTTREREKGEKRQKKVEIKGKNAIITNSRRGKRQNHEGMREGRESRKGFVGKESHFLQKVCRREGESRAN